jgi:hypothetical protein
MFASPDAEGGRILVLLLLRFSPPFLPFRSPHIAVLSVKDEREGERRRSEPVARIDFVFHFFTYIRRSSTLNNKHRQSRVDEKTFPSMCAALFTEAKVERIPAAQMVMRTMKTTISTLL